MKLDHDQQLLQVSRTAFDALNRDAQEALWMYSERAWFTRAGLCFVVAESRVAELQALAGIAPPPPTQTSASLVS
jgi:hypothetical protein